jgi:ABC-type glycerol-3-phosphate transport system substrate-binding protein
MNTSTRLVAAAAALLLAAGASAADTQAEHQHHQDMDANGAIAQLELNDGKKWATDASLRSGMAAIRAAFEADHPAIHAGKETDAQYAALADRIEASVKDMIAQCKLPPAADANLHLIIADLLQGVGFMRGQDPARSRHDGAARVHGALLAYPKFFDDPGWPAQERPAR